MKMGKGLMGLAAAAVLILGAASARAEFGSIAQASLDREINSPAVPATVPASEVYDTQNRAPGSIAQESLDREIASPKVDSNNLTTADRDVLSPTTGWIHLDRLNREITIN